MSLHVVIPSPLYTGGGTSTLVPRPFDVAINGRPYIVDTEYVPEFFGHDTIPLQKAQQDTSETVGEQTINPEGLWRKAADSWHKGAGQSHFDRPESDRMRFRSSKGIDPWTKWQITLLPDTGQKRASANTNLALMPAGSRLYIIDGATIAYTTDVTVGSPTFTAVTGGPAADPSHIASDGFNVWTTHGANGVYKTDTGVGTTASYATGTVSGPIAYVLGRLMVANQNAVYNVTAAGALPAALFTHANTDFDWVGFAAGLNHIYMAGFSGDKSLVYRATIKADATALDAPVVAAELPDGEIVRSINGYLGFIQIGTDKGVRFATSDDNGNLTLGPIIATSSAVRCFEGQDRFIWFGYTNYDASSTGLGRMDLTQFTNTLTPAYASDLMATGQGNVTSVVTFQSIRAFAVSGLGFYAETTTKVAQGTLDSGLITYGIPDDKVAVFLDSRHSALPTGATHVGYVATDGGAFSQIGTHTSTTDEDEFPVGKVTGERFEVRTELNRATDTTTGPTLTRITLKSYPAATPDEVIRVPLILREIVDVEDVDVTFDVRAERAALKELRNTRRAVVYQEGTDSYSVVVDDLRWVPEKRLNDKKGWQGTVLLRLKVVR